MVDSFEPGTLIPHCELSADFESEFKVAPLRYQVKLLGAKKPHNMFTIKPPSFTTKRSSSSADISGTCSICTVHSGQTSKLNYSVAACI